MADLCAPTYEFDNKDRWKVERKEDVKAKLGRSPDSGDALSLTFAEPVKSALYGRGAKMEFAEMDYDVLGYRPN
jgi:hypothetical protein